jgi:hypothetical protein
MRGDIKWRNDRKCLSQREEEKSELTCDIAVYYLLFHIDITSYNIRMRSFVALYLAPRP